MASTEQLTNLRPAGFALLATFILFMIGALVMHDWPPFMSFVILLVLSIGLIRWG